MNGQEFWAIAMGLSSAVYVLVSLLGPREDHPIIGVTTFEDPAITDPDERERCFGQNDHVRCYGRDFASRLEEARFQVEPIAFSELVGQDATSRLGMIRPEILFVCTKTD